MLLAAAACGHGDEATANTVTLTVSASAAPVCSPLPTTVETGVDMFAAGGGSLAYLKGSALFVLRVSDVFPVRIGPDFRKFWAPSRSSTTEPSGLIQLIHSTITGHGVSTVRRPTARAW